MTHETLSPLKFKSMKQLNVYFTFDGNCEQAMNFYAACLGGNIEFLQRFSDAPMETEAANKERVMHCTLRAGDIVLMASDSMPGSQVISGGQVNLSLNFDNENEQTETFHKLAEGGTITMPLEDAFWGARFGMLTDQFGVNWMFNHDRQPQE